VKRTLAIALCALLLGAGCADTGTAEPPEIGKPAAAPRDGGDLIAYTRNVRGDNEIFVARSDGSGRRRVTFGPRQANAAGNAMPAWSPDGMRIAYSAHRGTGLGGAKSALFSVRADGGGMRRLTRWFAESYLGTPAWSPDGSVITFSRHTGSWQTIEWIPAAGGSSRRLGSGPRRDSSPAWSPDGRSLAFTRLGDAGRITGEIWVMRSDGTDARRIAEDGGMASWSPDGKRIAFSSARDRFGKTYYDDRTDPNTDVYVMNADGSRQRRLTRNRANDGTPTWSPDGRWIVFDSGRPARINFNHHLWMMRADGSCQRRLIPGRNWSLTPAWQPGRPGASFPVPRCG